jgi:hypothetical protein
MSSASSVAFFDAPAFTGSGHPFHNQRIASGKTAVPCLPLCAPSPHTC